MLIVENLATAERAQRTLRQTRNVHSKVTQPMDRCVWFFLVKGPDGRTIFSYAQKNCKSFVSVVFFAHCRHRLVSVRHGLCSSQNRVIGSRFTTELYWPHNNIPSFNIDIPSIFVQRRPDTPILYKILEYIFFSQSLGLANSTIWSALSRRALPV